MTAPSDQAALAAQIKARVAAQRPAIIQFMRDLVAIPSIMGDIGAVGRRVIAEMQALGFDEARFDQMGNVIGRVGSGPTVLLYDSHLDTVDVGDKADWGWDPFVGKEEDGVLYAR